MRKRRKMMNERMIMMIMLMTMNEGEFHDFPSVVFFFFVCDLIWLNLEMQQTFENENREEGRGKKRENRETVLCLKVYQYLGCLIIITISFIDCFVRRGWWWGEETSCWQRIIIQVSAEKRAHREKSIQS